MKIKKELIDLKVLTEIHLEKVLQKSDIPPELLAGIKYSLMAGGKRIRPILCLKTYNLFHEDLKVALPFACGIEMLHTYSLIHDDLPTMDDDDYRRGILTNHKIFGEANALLAGDALFTWGFELMLENKALFSESNILAATLTMAKATGPVGMVGGQYLDMAMENQTVTLDDLQDIHRRKTGLLIQASVLSGALLAGAEEADLFLLKEYGQALGLLFQITDDLLDVRGDVKKMGKEVQKDSNRGKATFPGLLGVSETEKYALAIKEKAQDSLSKLDKDTTFLNELADYIYNREG